MTAIATNREPQQAEVGPTELLRALLEESRELTAVERFARAHDQDGEPAQAKYYRDLIPTGTPGEGEQYAFDVDLDACSGCKACVSACHHLNGLEADETWRSVGQLYGENGLPVIQHVTTACHHCVDPGCLNGCPTNAYEKDPETGVVRHLDDQCFGCQYCTMACPYEVPQYSKSKGIVRKCDMCHGRLAAGEAPACVQACPNGAIRITVVDQQETVARTSRGLFLPDSPPSELTNPTTVYRTERGLPTNTEGADAGYAEPQHAHAPLVVMLVLTQMSVGALAVGALAGWGGATEWADLAIVVGMLIGQMGLAVAPLHLGRPHLAFRAVLGWRHSWLSREAVMFGVYAGFSVGAAVFSVAAYWDRILPESITSFANGFLPDVARAPTEALAIISGAVAVYCSARIYMFTGREFWLGEKTLIKFGLTPVVLGLAVACAANSLLGGRPTSACLLLVVITSAKMAYEGALFWRLNDKDGDARLTAALQANQLRIITAARFSFACVGVLLTLIASVGIAPAASSCLALLAFLGGELAERWLYFASVVPLRMPGGVKS